MSLSETEVVASVERVTVQRLRHWVRSGWILPGEAGGALVYSEVDVARVRLLCELEEDLAIDEETLPVVLSLLDQIHGLRHELRALARAVEAQPADVRTDIARAFRRLSEE